MCVCLEKRISQNVQFVLDRRCVPQGKGNVCVMERERGVGVEKQILSLLTLTNFDWLVEKCHLWQVAFVRLPQ